MCVCADGFCSIFHRKLVKFINLSNIWKDSMWVNLQIYGEFRTLRFYEDIWLKMLKALRKCCGMTFMNFCNFSCKLNAHGQNHTEVTGAFLYVFCNIFLLKDTVQIFGGNAMFKICRNHGICLCCLMIWVLLLIT